jgi:hypothetical protein
MLHRMSSPSGQERTREPNLPTETPPDRPAIFDLDIGNDPDDTVVALLIARAPARFGPRLLLTNDETPALGRARFLSQIVSSEGLRAVVAAGLPSPRRSALSVVERAGLVAPGGPPVHPDGIGALVAAVDACDHVDYYSLGGLTNLAALLDRHPEFAERIDLIQMGPVLIERGLPRRPQYNVRLDPAAFHRVVPAVSSRTFLLSQISWPRHEPERRRALGLYPDDPVAEALARSPGAGHRLLHAQLGAWCQAGKPCSIQHDPLTTLSRHDSRLVRYETLDLQFDASGLADLSPSSRKRLIEMDEVRAGPLSGCLTPSDPIHAALQVTAQVSISADYLLARSALITGLLGPDSAVREADWSGFNRVRRE